MELAKVKGKHIYLVDGKRFDERTNAVNDVQFGLLLSDLKWYGQRGLSTAIAQFYEMVSPGLILTRHIFKGLNRGLYCDDHSDGDEEKLVYTRKPASDYGWTGGSHGRTIKRDAPAAKVFGVIISPNVRHQKDFPQIAGWIERWNWIAEDPALQEAPIDWVDRYDERLWTRG